MELSKVFLINISMLVTFAYLTNLLYKNVLMRFSFRLKYGLTVLIFVLAGCMTMMFSFEFGGARFDLRYVPVMLGLLVFAEPWALFLIGAGIGVGRLFYGFDRAGFSGATIALLIGLAAVAISYGFRKRPGLSYWKKATIAIFAINALRVILAPMFSVIPLKAYMTDVFPVLFPFGVLLSYFFIFMIRDFHIEQLKGEEIVRANRLLRVRTDDLNEAKSALEQKAEQLEASSRYKSEFMANMSHELKTPLNSILLLSQLQSDEDTSEEDRIKYARLIHQSGSELLNLVEDILDLTKVEAGKLDVTDEKVNLVEVCRTLEEQFEVLAANKGLDFRVTYAGEIPDWTLTDPMRLNQILRNLLSNAFKFTASGSVELSLTVATSSDGGSEARFHVIDTGAGILPEKQEEIFEAFRQEDGSISRKYGGTGLGLAISRQLAGLLGGRLEVYSEKGAGSCFTLTIPIRSESALAAV